MIGPVRNTFIPHEGNGYRPHSIQKFALLGMSVLVLLTFTMANLQSLLWINSSWLVGAVLPAVVVDLTNTERANAALGTLTRNAVLDQAAQLKAEDMATNSYFAHYSPTGVSPWYWFSQVNYSFVHAGENLAVHFNDSEVLVDAWMNSPSHRENIVGSQYTEIGVGTAVGRYEGFETVFVVQLFGTPAKVVPTPIAPAVATVPVSPTTTLQPTTTAVVLAEAPTNLAAEQVLAADSDPVIFDEVAVEDQAPSTNMSTTSPSTTIETDTSMPASTLATLAPPREESFLSTSTGGVAATGSRIGVNDDTSRLVSAGFLTQPQRILQGVYMVLATLIVLSLLLAIGIEIRRQQPVQIAYACFLLFLMGGLWYMHVSLTSTAVIV